MRNDFLFGRLGPKFRRVPTTYRRYIRAVDREIDRALPGMTHRDLPPRPYRQYWYDLIDPRLAARKAMADPEPIPA